MRASATAQSQNGSKRLSSDMQQLLSDAEDLLTRVTHIKDAEIDGVRRRLSDSVATARESLRSTANDVQKRAGAAARAADDYAHQSPWTLTGIGIFAGLTLGLLLSRRSSNE